MIQIFDRFPLAPSPLNLYNYQLTLIRCMGRKAKLKQVKRQNSENSATEVSKPSPEIPARNRPNPQL